VSRSDSPASAVLRSLDVDPDAALANEPGPFSMKPRPRVSPQEEAERLRKQAEQTAMLAGLERQRREYLHKRRRGQGY
jgi:hypothetical protein